MHKVQTVRRKLPNGVESPEHFAERLAEYFSANDWIVHCDRYNLTKRLAEEVAKRDKEILGVSGKIGGSC